MSYEIVYAREFLKTKDGRIIPLVLMGSNNCWTRTCTGRDRRERHWLALLSRTGESPAMAADELLERVYQCVPSKYQEHFVRNGKWVDDDAFVRFFKNGIKKAKTLEELNEELLVKEYPRGEVYYYDQKYDAVCLDSKVICSSDDLEEFLSKAEKIVNENKTEHKCVIDISFNDGDVLERPKKQRIKKEILRHQFYVVKTQEGYIRKLVAGRLYATGVTEYAKQFAKRKDAEKWIKDRNLERRFQRQTFEVEYVA